MKGTGYPLHSPVSPSLPILCVTVCLHISTGVYLQVGHLLLHCFGTIFYIDFFNLIGLDIIICGVKVYERHTVKFKILEVLIRFSVKVSEMC